MHLTYILSLSNTNVLPEFFLKQPDLNPFNHRSCLHLMYFDVSYFDDVS